jgi:hypothetical protein
MLQCQGSLTSCHPLLTHCVSRGRQKCYHWKACDPASLKKAQERLNGMVASHPYLSDNGVHAKLCFHFDNHQLGITRDLLNINYEPQPSNKRHTISDEYLNCNLALLQLSWMGGTEDRGGRVCAILCSYREAQNDTASLEAGKAAPTLPFDRVSRVFST